MGMLVCIDTHVLIWGIKKEAASSQRVMIERTTNFLQWLQNEHQTIIVPSPVLAEFLMRIPQNEHVKITRELQSRFIVPSYDAVAASMHAHIWQTNKNNGMPSVNTGRERMKTDSMIVAIAVANKAKIMYSEDLGLQKFAKGFIDVREIPKIPRQMTLAEKSN
jgi:predicted nucleic acid-binding protein